VLIQFSKELKNHAPFTVFGAITGIIIMMLLGKMSSKVSNTIFYILHPIHVVLSALVTASMYKLHKSCGIMSTLLDSEPREMSTISQGEHPTESIQQDKCGRIKGKCNLWILLIIGYVGSIGIATVSDSLIPYLGEVLLRMPNRGIHIGFIEKWWLVNPLASIGVAIAYFRPTTKFPHAGHVLLSTWASLFHIIMAVGGYLNWLSYLGVFLFLFLAVWIPCCVSDIVFPLLFVKD